jgi:hypothetical protein
MLRLASLLVPAAVAGLLLACSADTRPPIAADDAVAAAAAAAQERPDSTRIAFDRIMAFARDSALAEEEDFGRILQAVGRQLLRAPYVAGMLDAAEDETLVADLTAFDCVLYVENVLALGRMIAVGDTTFDAYVRNVEQLRYRGGEMDGYCSRLHYFTDWIAENERRGLVTDVASDSVYECIVGVEQGLRGHELFYIPKADIAASYDRLRPGDIIATATHIDGLDVTHTGFVYRTADGGTAFLNASLSGEVKIAEDLARYVQGVRAQTGILVARPADPRAAPAH